MVLEKIFFYPEDNGLILVNGRDREDFIQRQTTNDISRLKTDKAITSVLTNSAARILDVLTVFALDGETLGIVPLPGFAAKTTQYLKGMIFFNDQVHVQDASSAYSIIQLIGEKAFNIIKEWGWPVPERNSFTLFSFRQIPVTIFGPTEITGNGFRLVVPQENAEALTNALEAKGACLLESGDHEIWRVEAGLPGVRGELTDAFTPLEVGLEASISETKGCYTGQEVIARQITYDKITKKLVGLRLSQEVTPGDTVFQEEKPIGEVTSAVYSPTFGPIALAVLRKPHFEPGNFVVVQQDSRFIQATTSALPFPK